MNHDIPPDPFTERAPEPAPTKPKVSLEGLEPHELISLRAEIEARLPVKSLQDTDLVRELVLQVVALQSLQNSVIQDMDTPANQKAQVANSLSSALANLVKVQAEIYTSERFKKIEGLLIEYLDAQPDSNTRQLAYDAWEKIVEGEV
jgi:uncharacterized Fe-S cluster-containing radical SAM superfamily protein